MKTAALRKWLASPRTKLIAAVAKGVREHLADLRKRGIDFYGYALLPGEPYEINSIAAATNSEADIEVPKTDDSYVAYRYGVDNWGNWDKDCFEAADALLAEANERFASMYTKEDEDDCMMDEFELAHSDALLEAIVSGLQVAKDDGVFGKIDPFLAVWISDSDHDIMMKSVRQLNSRKVAREFD